MTVDKHRARVTYRMALQAQKLVRPDRCSSCGVVGPVDGHHEAYDDPLAVVWLCDPCHRVADTERRARQAKAIRRAAPFALETGDIVIGLTEAGSIIGVSRRRIHQLLQEGRLAATQIESRLWVTTVRHAGWTRDELNRASRRGGPRGRAV